MVSDHAVVARVREARAIALLRRVAGAERVAHELAEAGVEVVEITLDSDDALTVITQLRERGDIAVLAGTVRTADEARAAVNAGAEALVSPVLAPAVAAVGTELRVPVVAGALTPTEIETAWRAGAALVKLFPARLGGPAYVADVLKPLPDVPLVCTGGVTAENAGAYLAAGAVAVAVSFRDADDVAAEAARLLAAVHDPT